MKPPFKIANVPAKNTNEMKAVVAPVAGKYIVRSLKTGDPLPEEENGVPYHEPEIPWPQPVDGVEHKPFKLRT